MKEFFDSFELTDPEPPLRWSDGNIGRIHHWPDVLAHLEWHGRMTQAWMKTTREEYVAS